MCIRDSYVLADESKLVTRLGQSVPIPVEVIPEALELVQSRLHENFAILSSDLRLAVAKDGPIITESVSYTHLCDAYKMPPKLQITPDATKVRICHLPTATPERRAASSFPPTA